MNNETFIKAQLAALAIQEGARHGGVHNMVAVAFVMRNRVDAGWYGGEWMDVIERAGDRVGTFYPLQPINLRDSSVKAFLQRVDDIYDGSEEDEMTAGALFYCELHRVDREWFKQNVLKDRAEHPMTGSVGQVSFFR